MKLLIFLVALVGLGMIGPNAEAGDTSCAIAVDHPLIGEARWYGLYYQDRKIGHATTGMTLESLDPRDATANMPLIVQRFSMIFKLEQSEEAIEQTRRFEANPPHRLIDGFYRSADRQITYRRQRNDLHLLEGDVQRIWKGLDRNLCDEEDIAIHRFLQDTPAVGSRIETADFDVEHQVPILSTHEVEDLATRRILGAEHVFHTLLTASSSEMFSLKARTHLQNGEAVNLFLGPMEFRAESEAIAREPNQGVDLFAEFEKPLNRPLARLPSIDSLTLKASIDDPLVTIDEVIGDAFQQRVEYLDDRTAIVRIAGWPAPENTEDGEKYLRPTSSHPADHPRLQALTQSILAPLGQDPSPSTMAKSILDFVADHIETVPESPYVYHTTSIFEVLDDRTGDCTEHSQLFVTLARAAGLPAREVSGFVYGGDDRSPSLGGHAWVEVLIDNRWIGMDPTWEEVEINRSHVQVLNDLVPSLAFEVVDIGYR